jgi:hypothetical protein
MDLFFSSMIFILGLTRLVHFEENDLIDMAFLFTGIYFGVGPWLSWLYGGTFSTYDSETTIWAYVGIVAYMVGLWISKKIFKLPPIGKYFKSQNVSTKKIFLLYSILLVIRIFAGIKYGLVFSGVDISKIEDPNIQLFLLISSTLTYGLWILLGGRAFSKNPFWARLLISIELAFVFTMGRRWLFAFITFIILSRIYSKRTKIERRHDLIFVIILAIFGIIANNFFLLVRNEMRYSSDAPFLDLQIAVEKALEIDSDAANKLNKDNLSSRPMIINFNKEIIISQEKYPLMFGESILSCAAMAVPDILWNGKRDLETEEGIQIHYGQRTVDTSSNWPAYGQADFGLLGCLLYGIIFSFIVFSITYVIRIGGDAGLFSTFIFAGIFFETTMVETEPTNLFVYLRNAVLLLVITLLYRKFKKSMVVK